MGKVLFVVRFFLLGEACVSSASVNRDFGVGLRGVGG
jgi:hypothetical protein